MIDGECLACQSDVASNLAVDRTAARVRSPRPVTAALGSQVVILAMIQDVG
jgi:hypothetical protein